MRPGFDPGRVEARIPGPEKLGTLDRILREDGRGLQLDAVGPAVDRVGEDVADLGLVPGGPSWGPAPGFSGQLRHYGLNSNALKTSGFPR